MLHLSYLLNAFGICITNIRIMQHSIYRLVSYYVSRHPGCPGSLFCHFESSLPTRYQFTGVLCGGIKNIQFPKSSGYKSHSLRLRRLHRLGFATDEIQK